MTLQILFLNLMRIIIYYKLLNSATSFRITLPEKLYRFKAQRFLSQNFLAAKMLKMKNLLSKY